MIIEMEMKKPHKLKSSTNPNGGQQKTCDYRKPYQFHKVFGIK